MERPRKQSFPGAGLPEDQDRREAASAALSGEQPCDLGADRDDPWMLAPQGPQQRVHWLGSSLLGRQAGARSDPG
jgi:hypothetical protein